MDLEWYKESVKKYTTEHLREQIELVSLSEDISWDNAQTCDDEEMYDWYDEYNESKSQLEILIAELKSRC